MGSTFAAPSLVPVEFPDFQPLAVVPRPCQLAAHLLPLSLKSGCLRPPAGALVFLAVIRQSALLSQWTDDSLSLVFALHVRLPPAGVLNPVLLFVDRFCCT